MASGSGDRPGFGGSSGIRTPSSLLLTAFCADEAPSRSIKRRRVVIRRARIPNSPTESHPRDPPSFFNLLKSSPAKKVPLLHFPRGRSRQEAKLASTRQVLARGHERDATTARTAPGGNSDYDPGAGGAARIRRCGGRVRADACPASVGRGWCSLKERPSFTVEYLS